MNAIFSGINYFYYRKCFENNTLLIFSKKNIKGYLLFFHFLKIIYKLIYINNSLLIVL